MVDMEVASWSSLSQLLFLVYLAHLVPTSLPSATPLVRNLDLSCRSFVGIYMDRSVLLYLTDFKVRFSDVWNKQHNVLQAGMVSSVPLQTDLTCTVGLNQADANLQQRWNIRCQTVFWLTAAV